jgi:hypothetical protein
VPISKFLGVRIHKSDFPLLVAEIGVMLGLLVLSGGMQLLAYRKRRQEELAQDAAEAMPPAPAPCRLAYPMYIRAEKPKLARAPAHADRPSARHRRVWQTSLAFLALGEQTVSDDPVNGHHLRHILPLGTTLLDHDAVQPFYCIAARCDAQTRDDRMDQRLHPAPNHRKAKAAGDTEMFDIIFIDAFGLIDKEAVEHKRSLSNAAMGEDTACNAVLNQNQSRSPISLCDLACT